MPDWEFFSWKNGFRQIVKAEIPCNWFQCQENSIDPVHFEWTHSNWSIRLGGATGPYTPQHVKVDFSEFEYGFQYKRIRTDTSEHDRLWTVGRVCLWPNGLFTGNHVEFRVPVDDENTLSVMWHFSRVPREREPYVQNSIPTWQGPIADPATGRWITSHVMNQDFVTWVGQGRIADRSQEYLAPSDRGIVMIRRRFLDDIKAIAEGKDPKAIIRDPAAQSRDRAAGSGTRGVHRGVHARRADGQPARPARLAGLHLPDWTARRGSDGVSRRDGLQRSGNDCRPAVLRSAGACIALTSHPEGLPPGDRATPAHHRRLGSDRKSLRTISLNVAAMGEKISEHVGRPQERFEDAALLMGRARFADDLRVPSGTLHAAILRSPHAHAEILSIDPARALAMPGIECIVTGEDARRWTQPFTAAVKSPIEYRCLATDRVRYAGEPVAVVVAHDRYRAEDALEAIHVAYRPLPAIVDPRAANVISDRRFRYGEPENAFASASHRISIRPATWSAGCLPL